MAKKKIQIYTDGACRGNPGPGGWGAVLFYQGHKKKISGYSSYTTNNQMELQAAISGIESVRAHPDSVVIDLYTDSVYVKQGITVWIKSWKLRHWKNAKREAIKNQTLWQTLDALAAQYEIHWHWVKGHAGDPGNELADQLARDAIDQYLKNL